jgi:hypothetical protein
MAMTLPSKYFLVFAYSKTSGLLWCVDIESDTLENAKLTFKKVYSTFTIKSIKEYPNRDSLSAAMHKHCNQPPQWRK